MKDKVATGLEAGARALIEGDSVDLSSVKVNTM